MSLLGTLPLTSSLDIFARGGALFLDQEIETRVSSPGRTHRTGEEIWMVGAGAQWSFTSRWAARLEYQLTGDLKYDNTGESSIDQASLSVVFKL